MKARVNIDTFSVKMFATRFIGNCPISTTFAKYHVTSIGLISNPRRHRDYTKLSDSICLLCMQYQLPSAPHPFRSTSISYSSSGMPHALDHFTIPRTSILKIACWNQIINIKALDTIRCDSYTYSFIRPTARGSALWSRWVQLAIGSRFYNVKLSCNPLSRPIYAIPPIAHKIHMDLILFFLFFF